MIGNNVIPGIKQELNAEAWKKKDSCNGEHLRNVYYEYKLKFVGKPKASKTVWFCEEVEIFAVKRDMLNHKNAPTQEAYETELTIW